MTVIPHGVTVAINRVDNFHMFPPQQAYDIIYNYLVPACEKKGVMLSYYGNHQGKDSLMSVEIYTQKKENHELFDVKRIQRVFSILDLVITKMNTYRSGSYILKYQVEHLPGQIAGTLNGDFIAAMLLNGHPARFGEKNEEMTLNCEFKAIVNNRAAELLFDLSYAGFVPSNGVYLV